MEVQYYRDFDSTRVYIDKILTIAQKHQWHADYLQALYNLSWCAEYHKRLAEFGSLIAEGNQFMAEHSEDLANSDPDFNHRAGMINATALYYFSISNYSQAIEEYSRIISLSTKPVVQDSALIRSTCNYVAQSYYELGNFDLSRQYFDLGFRYVNPGDPNYQYRQAMYFMYQGQSFFSLKEHNKAFGAFRKATALLEGLDYRPPIRNALRSAYHVAARYYSEVEKLDSALTFVDKSISFHVSDDPYYVSTHLLMGSIYFKKKKAETAIFHFEKALAISNKIYAQNHHHKAQALRGLGDVNLAAGNYRVAEDFYYQALAQLTNERIGNQISASSSPKESITIIKRLGDLYFKLSGKGKQKSLLDSCIQTLELGTEFIDGLRKELVNLETKEFIASESVELYALGVKAAYSAYKLTGDAKYKEKIFFFTEKSKSNILLDKALDAKARNFAGISEQTLERERELLGTLSVFKKRMLEDGNQKTQQQYLLAQREYLKFLGQLEDQFPAYHDLKYNTSPTLISDVRNRLSPTEALIEYFVTDSIIYIISIDHSKTFVDTVHWDARLTQSLNNLLASLIDPTGGETAGSREFYFAIVRDSHFIYQRILRPALARLTTKDLTIIADGKLSYLPFEVLATSPAITDAPDYSRLPYLVRTYEIRYAYSASLTLERMKPRSRYTQPFLGFAPSYNNMSEPGSFLAPLVHNRREVQEAADIWGGQMFVDSDASEKAFKENAVAANILHVAAHTVIDEIEYSNSGIAFLTEGQDDGFLYTYELYAMDLNADLAILSGCETGIGAEARGEGMRSLARAFKFAGCNSIVMSLWKVSDKAAREIMNEFHKNLKSGMEKDEALRQAKLTYLDNSQVVSPFYWSAFVLVGDDQPINSSNRTLTFLIIIAGAILILAFVVRKKIMKPSRSVAA